MQFMNSSLDKLVKNLSDNDFKFLSQEFIGNLLELVKQVGVYPYEYVDSFQKISDGKLPDTCIFLSFFNNDCISEKDYFDNIDMWMLKMKAMGDYHDLDLKTDILLLVDIFEKFISTCLEYCGLDP